MFLFNGKNNNLPASGNAVKKTDAIEEEGMPRNDVLETEGGHRARGAGARAPRRAGGRCAGQSLRMSSSDHVCFVREEGSWKESTGIWRTRTKCTIVVEE